MKKIKLTMNKSKMYQLLKGYDRFHLPKMIDCSFTSVDGWYWMVWYDYPNTDFYCRLMKARLSVFMGEIVLSVCDPDTNTDIYKEKLEVSSMIASGMAKEVS